MTLDLMLIPVAAGTRFANTHGDIDESFYENLELTLNNFANLLLAHSRGLTREGRLPLFLKSKLLCAR